MGITAPKHKTLHPTGNKLVTLIKKGKNDRLESEDNVDPVFRHHARVHISQMLGCPGN
jgi:hypothetical protein